MKLNLEQMRLITRGASRVEEKDGEYHLLRFTEAQAEAYREKGNMDHYKKTFATSGIRLAFRTDSDSFSFTYRLESASSRTFACFDVYQNGLLTHHFGADGKEVQSGSAFVTLLEGAKDVEVYLPWSHAAILSEVALDDGASLLPLQRKHTMIAFGDSITQGYDAIYPSLSYVCTLARLLDADVIDKGIGGDTFFPALSALSDAESPEYITVAYGTNDWSHCTREVLYENCRAFYQNLSVLYPNAKIFAISPICRLDAERNTVFASPAYTVDRLIREACADLSNITVLNGWSFTPAHKAFYSDDYLHPNDLGFGIYAQNLYREMRNAL